MATTIVSTPTPPQVFQPAFKRVQQNNDFDDAFACIAMITGKTLDEVKQTAIAKFKHPPHGPATCWVSEDLINKLLGHYGFLATGYRECTGISSLPGLAIGMVEYNPETEIGRHVLFHRMRDSKGITEYIIDPAYWIDPSKHVRTDIKGFPIAWAISIPQASYKSAAKGE